MPGDAPDPQAVLQAALSASADALGRAAAIEYSDIGLTDEECRKIAAATIAAFLRQAGLNYVEWGIQHTEEGITYETGDGADLAALVEAANGTQHETGFVDSTYLPGQSN